MRQANNPALFNSSALCATTLGIFAGMALPAHPSALEAVNTRVETSPIGQDLRNINELGQLELGLLGFNPTLSGDGRYLSYIRLVPDITKEGEKLGIQYELILVDRKASTYRVLIKGDYERERLDFPSLNGDGRYVVFTSDKSDLVPNDNNGKADVFLLDTQENKLELVSRGLNDSSANGESLALGSRPVSADGRFIVFTSAASNIVSQDKNNNSDVFLFDSATKQIERISLSFKSQDAFGSSFNASVSDNGRYVAFISDATNLTDNDKNRTFDVYIYDRLNKTAERANINLSGAALIGKNSQVSISGDGKTVAFTSDANRLVPEDGDYRFDTFTFDRQTKATKRLEKQSGSEYKNINLSRDGRHAVFTRHQVSGTEQDRNIVTTHVQNTETGVEICIDCGLGSKPFKDSILKNLAFRPVISADGKSVTFTMVSSLEPMQEEVFGLSSASIPVESQKAMLTLLKNRVRTWTRIFVKDLEE